jgi:O-antigen ligase
LISPGSTSLTLTDHIKRIFPFLLLAAYGTFLCSYFIFRDYSDPYRFFARVVFVLGVFVLFGSLRQFWRHPLFQVLAFYMVYMLLSGFWSTPFDWYQLGQKLTIAIYLLSFIAITHFLIGWDGLWYQRMLQICVLLAAVAALVSLLAFCRENPGPGTRLSGIGSLTNPNEFANVYGIFALLAMGFALQIRKFVCKVPFLLAIVVFICFAWFGQSRTAFASMLLALLILINLMLKQRRVLYSAILAVLAGGLAFVFPDLLEQALLRGLGLRPEIWTQIWTEAKAAPIAGHGLVSMVSVDGGEQYFETAHNAYLQVFWQGGVIGLCLFLAVLMVAFRYAWQRGRQQGDYTVFCILMFTACIMMTGVDTLIARPRDQWLLFWLPLALLLGYPSKAPHARLY